MDQLILFLAVTIFLLWPIALWTLLDLFLTPNKKDWAINVMFGIFEDED